MEMEVYLKNKQYMLFHIQIEGLADYPLPFACYFFSVKGGCNAKGSRAEG